MVSIYCGMGNGNGEWEWGLGMRPVTSHLYNGLHVVLDELVLHNLQEVT